MVHQALEVIADRSHQALEVIADRSLLMDDLASHVAELSQICIMC